MDHCMSRHENSDNELSLQSDNACRLVDLNFATKRMQTEQTQVSLVFFQFI